MTECVLTTGICLKLYSNKNYQTFLRGANLVITNNNISNIKPGTYGFIYDDFDYNTEILKRWKTEYPNIRIFTVAALNKTVHMDSKLAFGRIMKNSVFTPLTFNISNLNTIPDKYSNDLFFIKKNGSTGSRHVHISKYKDLSLNINKMNESTEYIIQKSMSNPDLYDGKRYKIRVHVILFDKQVYLHKNPWCTVSKIPYNIDNDNQSVLKEMNIICQGNAEKFIIFDEIEKNDIILDNIRKALEDFIFYYKNKIQVITNNEYVILGFDFVSDNKKNVHIIEINHRSNYSHPKCVSELTDIICMRDLFTLLLTNSTDNTNLELITDEQSSENQNISLSIDN
jgi:hypothetical protein